MRAFYKGWLPSVIGVVPYVGLNFAVYETLKARPALAWQPSAPQQASHATALFRCCSAQPEQDVTLKQRGLTDERDLGVVTRLTCGAVAGSVGQTVAYPLDVVRRRLQVTGWNAAGTTSAHGVAVAMPPAYTGMVDCFVQTVRTEGPAALFKGLWPNYLKVVPSIAIAFVTYEQLKTALGVDFRISD